MEIHERLKSFRKGLNISQKQFAENLGFKQSYYSEVEGGKRQVTSKLIEALREKYNLSSDWMYTGYGNYSITKSDIKSTPNNVPSLYPKAQEAQDLDKIDLSDTNTAYRHYFTYMHKFKDALTIENPHLSNFPNDILDIFLMREVIGDLGESKIGNIVYWATDNIKKVTSYKEFKDIGFQVFKEVEEYHLIVHEYANACRKFVNELSKIKDKIGLEIDLDEWK